MYQEFLDSAITNEKFQISLIQSNYQETMLFCYLGKHSKDILESAIFNVKIKYPSLNQFFEPCCLLYWQTFLCWHIPSPVIIHLRSYDGFFCSCKCELAATASKQTLLVPLLHTTHCRGDLLPTMGEGSSSPSKELRYSWLWISDKLYSIISSQEDRKRLGEKKGEWKACDSYS